MLREGLDLFERHPSVGAFDGVLAAAAIRLDSMLVSADQGFATVQGLHHVDPADPNLADQLPGLTQP